MDASKSEGALLDELRTEFPDFGIAIYQYDPMQPAMVEMYRTTAAGDLVRVFSGEGFDLAAALAAVLSRARSEFAPPPNIFD